MGRWKPPRPGRIPPEDLPPPDSLTGDYDWSAAVPMTEGVHCITLFPNGPKTLIPTAAEVTTLPRNAQRAVADRYLEQLALVGPAGGPAPVGPPAAVVEWAALEMVRRAMHRTPVGNYLRFLRYDFDKLVNRAKAENWTDDTAVPSDTFEPLRRSR